jgi:hypothetical protein
LFRGYGQIPVLISLSFIDDFSEECRKVSSFGTRQNTAALGDNAQPPLIHALGIKCIHGLWTVVFDCKQVATRRIIGQGTPMEVWYLMEQTWTAVGAPSNARITGSISGWERMCDKIIEAKACIVPYENFRTGRRARKMRGEGELETKHLKRDRKSTHLLHLPAHPALVKAYKDLRLVLAEFKISG